MSEKIGAMRFDAVYSSPLIRAVQTAALIGKVGEEEVIRDKRIIETGFGKYEACNYYKMGPLMTLYWSLPELFKAPETVETVESMVKRSHAFLAEIESKGYENVLIICHGGIIRGLCGYLEDRPNGIKWRPRPKNCEIRVYETSDKGHRFIKSYELENGPDAEY